MSTRGTVQAGAATNNNGSTTTREQLTAEFTELVAWVVAASTLDLRTFERGLLRGLWKLGRLMVRLFLETREAGLAPTLTGPRWQVARSIATTFGPVRMLRTYVRGDDGHGEAPLDRALGITSDLVSANLLGLAALLATQMPYEHVREVLRLFVGYVPSAKTIQRAVLGFGALANTWLETMPLPAGDGDVMIILFDSKGVPTATEEELRKRRRKRRKGKKAASPRHRGRDRRMRWNRRRRRKGDKAKNARLATVVVIYTLQRRGSQLLGPRNKTTYVSFGPKEVAFQWAQRHAERRGFGAISGKMLQVVTDGDEDLAVYTNRYFPHARHTLDVFHAFEYVWEAGTCIHGDGAAALDRWYRAARDKVFAGKIGNVLDELRKALAAIPKTGPGNKGRRTRLEGAIAYLTERLPMMNYKKLIDLDLEIGSGAVEGAVNHLVRLRFDHGGMRWIRERAQPLLQLRCIHLNGDWDAFLDWALPQLTKPTDDHPIPRIQRNEPAALPALAEAA